MKGWGYAVMLGLGILILSLWSSNKALRSDNNRLQRAEDLGLQVKRLQAASKTETQTKVEIQTVVKDSIIYRNGILDSLKRIEWRDPWVSVEGTLKKDSLNLNVTSVDTLYQFIHRVPHKFWFIKWGTKAIRQEITTSNPHSKIVYTEYIELKK